MVSALDTLETEVDKEGQSSCFHFLDFSLVSRIFFKNSLTFKESIK